MDDFGELILSDKFPMQSNGVESDYNLYLFENILLCCKEYRKKKKKKGSKEVIPLSLKGNIYITSIGGVQDTSTPDTQQFCLQVYWRDGTEMETSALTCRNIEQVKLWHDRLERLIAAERSRRRSMMDVATRGMSRMNVSSVDDDNDDTAEAEYSLSPTGLVMPSRRKSEANLHVEAAAAASAAYALNANYPGSPSVNRTRVMAPWEASPQSPSQQSIASSSSPPSRKSIPATPRGSSLAGANEYIQQLNNYHRPPSTTLSTQSINAQQALSSSFTGSTTTATIGSNQYHHRSTSDSPSSPFNTAAAAGNLATSSSSPPSRYIAMPPPPTHQPPPPPPNLRSSLSSMSISGGSSSSSALPTPPVSTPGSPRMRPGPSGNHPPPHIVTRSSSTYSSNGVQGDTYNIPHQPASSSTSPSQFVQNFYSNDSGNTSQHHGNNYNSNRFSRSTSGAISDAEARLNARRQLLRASAPAPPPAGFGPPPSIPLPPPPSSGNSQTVSPPSSGGSIGGMVTASYQIRIKLHFGSDVFLLAVPYPGCLFVDFQSKVERKIRYSGAQRPEGQPLLMKYRDEEGDLINISNDSDVALALYYAAQSGRNDLQVFIT